MMSKVAFFSEGGYNGKVPRNIPMRTDQAWVCALDATHYCVFQLDNLKETYDIGVIIIPKEKKFLFIKKFLGLKLIKT